RGPGPRSWPHHLDRGGRFGHRGEGAAAFVVNVEGFPAAWAALQQMAEAGLAFVNGQQLGAKIAGRAAACDNTHIASSLSAGFACRWRRGSLTPRKSPHASKQASARSNPSAIAVQAPAASIAAMASCCFGVARPSGALISSA